MENLTKLFEGNPVLNILFLVIALLGLYLSFFFYFKALRIKNPVYTLLTTNLINSKISTIQKIEIRYKDTVLKNLSLTKVCFWNSGKEPIRKEDITIVSPLSIHSKDGVIIYDFEIVHMNEVNNISLTKLDDNNIRMNFDFLDFQDGYIVNIYHNGKSDKDFSIEGKIIGAKKIEYGIKSKLLLSKIEFISIPINYLINRDGILFKILSFPVLILTFIVMIPLMCFVIPIDEIRDKIMKQKIPKQFYLHD